jgi:hypothetical protein
MTQNLLFFFISLLPEGAGLDRPALPGTNRSSNAAPDRAIRKVKKKY